MAERLQKVMANAGVASRRASEKLIQEGRVMVNGVVVTELGTKVESDDSISVDGKLLKKDEKKVYYLLYKPRGVISAAKDNKRREVVTDYLKDVPERLYPVGRLDYDTSGLLILSIEVFFLASRDIILALARLVGLPSITTPLRNFLMLSGVISPSTLAT